MRPTLRELSWLFASWLLWACVALHVRGAWDTILEGGDHWSHFGCAELFLLHGFDLWDHPPAAYCGKVLPADKAAFRTESECRPEHVCSVRDHPELRPLCINWQEVSPQAYPPGLVLYSLPQAWLYEHTRLTFRQLNVLTILEYLAAAHLLFWLLLRLVFSTRDSEDLPGGADWEPGNPWLRLGLFGLLYLAVIQQVLNGFYDPLPIAAVLFGIYHLAKQRPVDALLALSVAFFLHYRAIWYAPLLGVALLRSLPAIWATPRKTALKACVAGALLLLFAASLFLIYPWLHGFPKTNPVLWQKATLHSAKEWALLVPMAIVFLYLAWGRHWLVLCTMVWQLWVISSTPQVFDWHALFLLPMLGVARLDEERGVMLAAFAFYVVEAAVVFDALPLPGRLLTALAAHWGPMSF